MLQTDVNDVISDRHNGIDNDRHAMQENNALPSGLNCQLTNIRRSVQRIELRVLQQYRAESSKNRTLIKWRTVANAMDRLFFTFYLILIVSSLIMIFPKPLAMNLM